MNVTFTVKPLEEICFTHIVMTLDEYSADHLALLPGRFRKRLLHSLPVVNICRLEGTRFTSGIDMESFWEELTKEYIDPHPSSLSLNWRHHFFTALSFSILRDERWYDYRRDADYPFCKYLDSVNFLVAMKREDNTAEEEKRGKIHQYHFTKFRYQYRCRCEVTPSNSVLPPAKMYHLNLFKLNQLVPPRYRNFISKGNCFLPDSSALELINNKCHFRPKEVIINVPRFATFLLNAEQERDIYNFDYLVDFFKDIESLVIESELTEFTPKRRAMFRAEVLKSIEMVPSRILNLIFTNDNHKLTTLSIDISRETERLIHFMTPVLISSYDGIEKLKVRVGDKVSPGLMKLISITEYQSTLHTISITMNSAIILPLLQCWLKSCFEKPSLHCLNLCFTHTTAEYILEILTVFCSVPCSHDQTLTLSLPTVRRTRSTSLTIDHARVSLPEKLLGLPAPPSPTTGSKPPIVPPHIPHPLSDQVDPLLLPPSAASMLLPPSMASLLTLPTVTVVSPLLLRYRRGRSRSTSITRDILSGLYPHYFPWEIPHPSPVTDKLLKQKFNVMCTLQYKSLVFENSLLGDSCFHHVLRVQVQLKQFVITGARYSFFRYLARTPSFDMQLLKICSMQLPFICSNDFDILLQKKSLKIVTFMNCDFSLYSILALCLTARKRDFLLEETTEIVKSYETPTKKSVIIYTLTKK